MKHVLVLNQFAVPRTAAGGTRHVELFGRLDTWSARILVGRTTLSGERIASDDLISTVPVTPYRGNGLSRIFNWAAYSVGALAAGLVSSPRPDVVYASSPHLGAALAGRVIASVRRRPLVVEVRDLWPQILAEAGTLSERSTLYRLLKRLELYLYRSADRIVVLAEANTEVIAAQGPWRQKIWFIPNGADPEDFDVGTDREVLRDRYGFEQFTVVYAGAHGPANGLDFVLDAAARLSGEPVEFVLLGDGIEKPALRKRAEREGLDNVRFMDPVPKSEIKAVFAAADAGLHCLADVDLFRSGVSPNKLYDYMAAGLPVITNTPGEVGEMVRAAACGIAAEPDGLADAVRTLVAADDEELASLGRLGRQFVHAHRSRQTLSRRLRDLLDTL